MKGVLKLFVLISEEVLIKWHTTNKKWYESKGYIFTKYKDEFKVRIHDLTSGSSVSVEVKCDCVDCLNPYLKPILWQNYLKYIKEDGKYYCNKCASNLFGKEKTIKTKLKNTKSFEQWCVENNRQDVLDRWDYDLNDCKPNEICVSTNKKYYFKCPINSHLSELKIINSFTYGQEGSMDCQQCNSFAQYLLDNYGEEALDRYWDWDKNININFWHIAKSTGKIKVWIKCQDKDYHGSYDITPNHFITGNRCPYCTNRHGKVHPLDSLGKLLEDKNLLHLWSNRNKKSPYEYTPKSNQEVYWKCPEGTHKDYPRSICGSNKSSFRCPECQYSKGEERVSNYFINLGFIKIIDEDYIILDDIFKEKYHHYIPQKEFDGLVGLKNGNLSYDFYLPNLQYNLLIEYDGEYHYMPIRKYKNEPIKYAEERLKKQQEHDRLKTEYAESYNINLLRIPYWEFDNIEDILDEYLNNINNLSEK